MFMRISLWLNVSGINHLRVPYHTCKRNMDLLLEGSRILNKPDDVTISVSYTCDQPSATDIW